eukprot:CAMPEP_0185317710 /NCGR_PEP_ID=MMETSP1363-20130426/47466_1 /TAXON_ID=38817 /ORGANISM="Gephyrocapsa oceanica, Strain RCC1303" /LENGTH=95 /DNA_ID=CAMNT_0027915965 /DNA_START=157 /DNA_END=444 /DNA_ORIENTATION=+
MVLQQPIHFRLSARSRVQHRRRREGLAPVAVVAAAVRLLVHVLTVLLVLVLCLGPMPLRRAPLLGFAQLGAAEAAAQRQHRRVRLRKARVSDSEF